MMFFHQYDSMDCAPACLKMIANYYGKNISLDYLRNICHLNRQGVSLLSLNSAAEKLGFKTMMVQLTLEKLAQCTLPAILHWDHDHYVVLQKIKKKADIYTLYIADPAHGTVKLDKDSFFKKWCAGANKGIALLLEATPSFYELMIPRQEKDDSIVNLIHYLRPHYRFLWQLSLGMLAASLISLSFPFLTQILVDYGIKDSDLNIVYLILLSQLFLFIGNSFTEIIQGWLLLHMSARISLSVISEFLARLLQLPLQFFDSKAVGDLSQRINDHRRIESFLTSNTLSFFFSAINLTVYIVVLGLFDLHIMLILVSFSMMAVSWILFFQKKRKQLDYKKFIRNKENQDKLFELIYGMHEIKLYGGETSKRWEWERLQVALFHVNLSGLSLEQYQKVGFSFLSQLKNIIISYIAAREVINGHLTLGVLLSISYIIGQTNGPLEQLISYIRSAQDARLSMNRIREISKIEPEEQQYHLTQLPHQISPGYTISFRDVSFRYGDAHSKPVLHHISLVIPKGKVTAIVGTSGSGKTTLMKLLLGFYKPVSGSIIIGETTLSDISPGYWRTLCGTVMQDGFIFSDSILHNICIDGNTPDQERLTNALDIANCNEFIEYLPLGIQTKIGGSGIGLSGGQRQRILLARAIYKNPDYLFLDEATSSLDANNEKTIMSKLDKFFKGKTVVIIAHRLSTVKNADQIIVLEKGKIVETGTHHSLTREQQYYFSLVKNQLELGG